MVGVGFSNSSHSGMLAAIEPEGGPERGREGCGIGSGEREQRGPVDYPRLLPRKVSVTGRGAERSEGRAEGNGRD